MFQKEKRYKAKSKENHAYKVKTINKTSPWTKINQINWGKPEEHKTKEKKNPWKYTRMETEETHKEEIKEIHKSKFVTYPSLQKNHTNTRDWLKG